jgi:hypothetical protein
MSKPLKPSLEMYLNRKIMGHSPARVIWEDAKKKAGRTGINLSALGKEDLGPALDGFRQYVKGAADYAKVWMDIDPKFTFDDKTLKRLRESRQKVLAAIDSYINVCATQANNSQLSPAQAKAWTDLKTTLETQRSGPNNLLRAYNNNERKKYKPALPEIKL